MKKSRILISSAFLAGAVAASIAAAGCAHKHAYSGEWTKDEINHWHAATCKHTGEKQDVGAHEYDKNYVCTVCDYQHEHTWNSSFVCTGCNYAPADVGIVIVKGTTEYTLDASTKMTVPMDDFIVKAWKENGMEANEIANYELTYYKGNEKIANLNNVTEGAYNVWATATVGGKETETFVVIYILDEIESIAVKSDEGTFEQNVGIDKMSKTWKFVATYKSGRTEELDASKVDIKGVVTNKESEESTKATVSYSYKNVKGKETTVDVDVPYTVTKGSVETKEVIKTYSFDELVKGMGDSASQSEVAITQGNMTGVNNFLTVLSGEGVKVNYRGPSNNVLEIRGDALSVTFEGTGTLVINPRSTGETNTSTIALKDAEGNLIAASYDTANANIHKDDDLNAYTITGKKNSNTLTFTIESAGTYTICTLDKATVNGVEVATGRNVRVDGLVLTDNVPTSGEVSNNVVVGNDQLTAGDIIEKKELADGISVIPAPSGGSAVTVEEGKKTYAVDDKNFTNRIKLNGSGDTTKRCVEITTFGKAKIVVYGLSGKGTEERDMTLSDGTKETSKNVSGSELTKVEFEVEDAGTFYLYCKAGSSYIYGIEIIYD